MTHKTRITDSEILISDMVCANGEASLVRKPIDPDTGQEYIKCSYALFAGCGLGACEPELIVKLYDSIRFQHGDTGIILLCCGYPARISGAEDKSTEALEQLRSAWEELGRPQLICPCPACTETINEYLPDIPTVSLYRMLIDLGISGGCNSTEYCLWKEDDDVRELAEDMGVKFRDKPSDESSDPGVPYITCDINTRNALKNKGLASAHILELIYGMGESNSHLIHEHEHDDAGGSSEAPHPAANAEGTMLPDSKGRRANLLELKKTMLDLFWG